MSTRLAGVAPWSGMIAAGLGFGLFHQVVSDGLHFGCHATDAGAGIAWGLVGLAVVLLGAFGSWRARPEAQASGQAAALRRFVVNMSLMAALLAALGIVFMLLAVLLLPGCRS